MTPLDKIILGIDPGTNVLGYGVIKLHGRKVTMEAMGVIDLRQCKDTYLKLGRIYERVMGIIDAFKPDELAIEAPFFGKNVQSMLKLGRAQGVVIAAAICRDIPIHEYAPPKNQASYYRKWTSQQRASCSNDATHPAYSTRKYASLFRCNRCLRRSLLPLPAKRKA